MPTADQSVEIQPETAELLAEICDGIQKATGRRPAPDEVIRSALQALHASEGIAARQADVVTELLQLGQRLAIDQVALGKPSFTDNEAANDFVIADPFAFPIAVIFEQGIIAERAWAAPYELRSRLGHLDPRRIAVEAEQVAAAVREPPSLHRYVEKVPRWVVAASRRVVSEYGGNASRIWSDHPTAGTLQARLDAFEGIGQKKAAMAVEILDRDLKVPIGGLEGSDIAYDVHVRRVFLRTGLALFDDPIHMISVARRLNRSRPGAVDFPAWTVGRNWCRAGVPDCQSCPLRQPCPKLVEKGDVVRTA